LKQQGGKMTIVVYCGDNMDIISISGGFKGEQIGAQAIRATFEAELAADVVAVGVDGGGADPEADGDLLGAKAFANQPATCISAGVSP
jgi:hypothetical protein